MFFLVCFVLVIKTLSLCYTRKCVSSEALQLEGAHVILSFNYSAHNAPAYKFNNSAGHILTVGGRLPCDLDL